MIHKTSNFKKLRDLLDPNKYSDEYVSNLLALALNECLTYIGRDTIPNENSNEDVFNMAVCIVKNQSKQPIYESLSKYVIQGYYAGVDNVIFVDYLPKNQEKDQIYVIKGKTTSKFYQNGKLIKTVTNQDDDSPYYNEDGELFQDHKISAGGGATYTAGTNIEITEDNVINCTINYDNYENQTFPINGGD